jgi:hypothetical protein
MARRFDLGRALLALGSVLLFVSLYLDWYDTGQSGWEVFEALDLVLTALAVAGIWAALRYDLVADWVPAALALAAVVIVFVQLVEPPPAAGGGDPSTGAWLALGASLLMAAGAVLSLARFAILVEMREHDRRRRMAAVDRRADAQAASAPAAPAAEDDDLGRTESFTALAEDDDEPAEPRP